MSAHEAVAVGLLVIMLGVALWHPTRTWEAAIAVVCGLGAVSFGGLSLHQAWRSITAIGPVVAFLLGILVLAETCHADGLFDALGDRLARTHATSGNQFLHTTVAIAAATTTLLSLDATVVLLTPPVSRAAQRRAIPRHPHETACVRLANSASLLLPVSNLTNLLVFGAIGLSFVRFTVALAPVWIVVIGLETIALQRYFRRSLQVPLSPPPTSVRPLPATSITVVVLALVGFVVSSFLGINLAWVVWVAALGASVVALRHRRVRIITLATSAQVGFAVYVCALAVVVHAVAVGGVGSWLHHVVPTGEGLGALVGTALVAMIAANLLNNLPAALLLITVVTPDPPSMLAMLIGLNAGAAATYPGSLANLLWVRTLRRIGRRPGISSFHRFGLTRTPIIVILATTVLWGWLRVLGWH